MNRPILTFAFIALASAALSGQQAPPADPYQGQSHPPADNTIVTVPPDQPKPRAGKPLVTPAQPPASQPAPIVRPALATLPADGSDGAGTDDGVVQVAPASATPAQPALASRADSSDPDGDIVHSVPLPSGAVEAGTMIRARLLTRLSTSLSERGDEFRATVASDVIQDGQVLIPTGAEIDGSVVEVSEGHPGGHGSMRLRPDTVILPNGSRFRMDAQVVGTPGAKTNVTGEGVINAGSRWKKDGIEYAGAVGAGAATGAVLAGPLGAATGSIVGAGLMTVHLLADHPQATLEPGTVLLFTLNERLNLVASSTPGS
jgi:hypothetical protein